MKYWCMLKRKEETRSLSGMVVEIMVLGVRGHEIPRCCARSKACVVWRGNKISREGKEEILHVQNSAKRVACAVCSRVLYSDQFVILFDGIGGHSLNITAGEYTTAHSLTFNIIYY